MSFSPHLTSLNFPSLSPLFSRLLYSRCCFLCIYLTWSLYSFLNLWLHAFGLIRNMLCHCLFRCYFCFHYLLIMHILVIHSIVSNLITTSWIHNFSYCIFNIEFVFHCFSKICSQVEFLILSYIFLKIFVIVILYPCCNICLSSVDLILLPGLYVFFFLFLGLIFSSHFLI